MNESLAKQLHDLVDKHKLIVDAQVNESISNLKEDLRKVFEIDIQETPNNNT